MWYVVLLVYISIILRLRFIVPLFYYQFKPKIQNTLWTLNSSKLNSPQTKEKLQEEIQSYLELNDSGEVKPPMLWDAFKPVMGELLLHVQPVLKKIETGKIK